MLLMPSAFINCISQDHFDDIQDNVVGIKILLDFSVL